MQHNRIYNIDKVRNDFPILQKKINGYPLAYLDNAATTQKPRAVISTLEKFYQEQNANVHRGIHHLAEVATTEYENARQIVHDFLHAKHAYECIFVRGTTEGINLVANGFAKNFLHKNDEIILSQMEHHANIVPWQLACEVTGAKLCVIPCSDDGELQLDAYQNLLNNKTKIVAITHVSNVLGTINPIKRMIEMAHANGTPVLIDGAQALAHLTVDVQDLDCDFYAFSSHKLYGPTGIGVLYGKESWLDLLPPYQGGGEMIKSVSFEKTLFQSLPHKFEAGTPPIASAIGLKSAIHYLQGLGLEAIFKHEQMLQQIANKELSALPFLRLIGTASEKMAIDSFVIEGVHPHDIGTAVNQLGIAVRSGQLCAQPCIERFGIKSVVRASFGLYNTLEEIQRLILALDQTYDFFRRK